MRGKCSGIIGALWVVAACAPAADLHVGPQQTHACIAAAVQAARSGDRILIHPGVYRESVRVETADLTLLGLDDAVVVTGLDPVSGWEVDEGGVYRAAFAFQETPHYGGMVSGAGQVQLYTQLFMDGRRMPLATYPDRPDDLNAWAAFGMRTTISAEAPQVTLAEPLPHADWIGGHFHSIAGHAWLTQTGHIAAATGTTLTMAQTSTGWAGGKVPAVGEGTGYILRHRNALDSPGEWHWQDDTLFFWPPDGVDPDDVRMEARRRDTGLVITDTADGLQVSGIHFRAARVTIDGASDVTISDCRFTHATPYHDITASNGYGSVGDIDILGPATGSRVERCYLAHSWGSGVVSEHENASDITVADCLIADVCWMSTYNAGIKLRGGTDKRAIGNTVRHVGTNGIQATHGLRALIAENDVVHCLALTRDRGVIQGNAPVDGSGSTTIRHNWVHDSYGIARIELDATAPGGERWDYHAVGIYNDGGSQNTIVHHNVIWNIGTGDYRYAGAIFINRLNKTGEPAEHNEVHHNTIWNCVHGMVGSQPHTTRVYNNLSDVDEWRGSDIQNNLVTGTPGFHDVAAADFRLRAGSPAVDHDGILLPGINDTYAGASPDNGAYEYGGGDAVAAWMPGVAGARTSTDDFESADGAGGHGWATDWAGDGGVIGNDAHTGAQALELSGAFAFARSFDLSGNRFPTLGFWWCARGWEGDERVLVEFHDGARWTPVLRLHGAQADGRWHLACIDLASFTLVGTVHAIRLRAVASFAGDDVLLVDDIRIEDASRLDDPRRVWRSILIGNEPDSRAWYIAEPPDAPHETAAGSRSLFEDLDGRVDHRLAPIGNSG